MNLYSYVTNDPTNWVDPYGLFIPKIQFPPSFTPPSLDDYLNRSEENKRRGKNLRDRRKKRSVTEVNKPKQKSISNDTLNPPDDHMDNVCDVMPDLPGCGGPKQPPPLEPNLIKPLGPIQLIDTPGPLPPIGPMSQSADEGLCPVN